MQPVLEICRYEFDLRSRDILGTFSRICVTTHTERILGQRSNVGLSRLPSLPALCGCIYSSPHHTELLAYRFSISDPIPHRAKDIDYTKNLVRFFLLFVHATLSLSLMPSYVSEGRIVPAEITVGLLRKAMEASGKSRFLIDGFPRNPENFASWEGATSDGSVVVDFALFLDCPEEVMTRIFRLHTVPMDPGYYP